MLHEWSGLIVGTQIDENMTRDADLSDHDPSLSMACGLCGSECQRTIPDEVDKAHDNNQVLRMAAVVKRPYYSGGLTGIVSRRVLNTEAIYMAVREEMGPDYPDKLPEYLHRDGGKKPPEAAEASPTGCSSGSKPSGAPLSVVELWLCSNGSCSFEGTWNAREVSNERVSACRHCQQRGIKWTPGEENTCPRDMVEPPLKKDREQYGLPGFPITSSAMDIDEDGDDNFNKAEAPPAAAEAPKGDEEGTRTPEAGPTGRSSGCSAPPPPPGNNSQSRDTAGVQEGESSQSQGTKAPGQSTHAPAEGGCAKQCADRGSYLLDVYNEGKE